MKTDTDKVPPINDHQLLALDESADDDRCIINMYWYKRIRERLRLSEAERDDALAQNVALWRVYEAAKNEMRASHELEKQPVDIDSCTEGLLHNLLADRIYAWRRLSEAIADVPPRDGKGAGKDGGLENE